MSRFDRLPPELRSWLWSAALPWSPASAERIWSKALAKGKTPKDAVDVLDRAEAQMLARDKTLRNLR